MLTKCQYKCQYDGAMDTVTYTIDQICEMTGVPRRTVRYYVEEGLLEPPIGRGRGGNYLDSHVERLRKIKSLQEQGWTLSSIERHLKTRSTADALEISSAEGSSGQEKVGRFDIHDIEPVVTPASGEVAESRSLQATTDNEVRRTVRSAFLIAPGIEIVVDREAEAALSRKIQEIVRIATTILSGKE